MKTITIEADNVNIDTVHYDNQVKIEITNPQISFIQHLEIDDIIMNIDNEELFEKIIENDDEVLHKYLESHGYIFNKS